MKRKLSVMALAARATFFRLLAVLGGMALLEWILFSCALRREAETGAFLTGFGMEESRNTVLTGIFGASHIHIVCGICFVLFTFALCYHIFGQKGSRVSLTFSRLAMTQKEIFSCLAIYNSVCYLLFWGVQAVLLLGFCGMYAAQPGDIACGPQTVLLTFYGGFPHMILPVGEEYNYLFLFVSWVCVGIATAQMSMQISEQRAVSLAAFAVVWVGAALLFQSADVVISMMSVPLAAVVLTLIRRYIRGGEGHEKVSV